MANGQTTYECPKCGLAVPVADDDPKIVALDYRITCPNDGRKMKPVKSED